MRGVGGDHEEPVRGQLGHGQVGLEQPALVEPLGVGDDPRVAVDGAGRHPVQQRARARALDGELRHEGHVDQPDVLAHGPVLGRPAVEPRRPAPGRGRLRGAAGAGEPRRALPARRPRAGSRPRRPAAGAPATAARRGPCAAASPAGARRRRCRGSRSVRAARYAGASWWGRKRATSKPVTSTSGRPVDDPVRQHPAQAARGQDADGVHPGRDEVAADAGRLADRGGEVGGERLGPAEERADPDLVGDRHPVHGLLEERRHPVPVGRQRAEGEVRAGCPRPTRRRPRARRGRPSSRRPPRGSSRRRRGPRRPARPARAPRWCR